MKLMATWTTTVLDSGRMLLIKVSMEPGMVRAEVKGLLDRIGSKAPPKGFRAGKVAESVLRRIHGKRVLSETRTDLVAKSYEAAVVEAAKKYGFDPKTAPAPTGVKFSEEAGLSYEVLVTGLSLSVATAGAPDVVVDLRKKES